MTSLMFTDQKSEAQKSSSAELTLGMNYEPTVQPLSHGTSK